MGQELVLPDWAKAKPAGAFAVLNPAEDSLSDGIGQSYPVLSYKGKVWAIRHRGERKNFIRPDDGTPASYLDVIILGQAKQKSKSYYETFDPNNAEGGRPICSSIDGVTPDPDVLRKQCDSCALCPRNQWKTGLNGKKGRECTDYKRLAVLVLPTQTKPLFGEPVLEPAFLRVPPASLNSLAIMGDTMAAQGFHYSSYITRISFDPNEAHPKMVFRPYQGLSEGEAPAVLQLREDMTVGRIINGGYAEGMRTIPPQEGTTLLPPGSMTTGLGQTAPAQLTLTANPQPSTAGVAQPPQTSFAPPAQQPTVSQAAVSAPPATPATPPPAAQQPAAISTGLSGLVTQPDPTTPSGLAMPAAAQPATGLQTAGDTGAPEATDDDLDAQIAGMLSAAKKN
jgi:hypothetical protein